MTSMSTSSRRVRRRSRSRTRGNEVSSRGPAPTNRNTVNGEDSTAHRRNGTNSNSESTQNTPPESRSGNDNRRPSDASDRRQRGDRSNSTERDGSEDPGTRKRKLNEAIAEAISSRSPFKKFNSGTDDDSESDIYTLYHRARAILRFLGPTLNIRTTIIKGSRLASNSETSSDSSESDSEHPVNDQALSDAYQKVLAFMPGLEDQIKWTQKTNPSGIRELASFLDKAAKKGRSDDTGSLRNACLNYIHPVRNIPGVDDVPTINVKGGKENRGFNHHASARLLCPRNRREEFDRDREAFCRDVQNGRRAITHKSWPSFLYPEDEYNPDGVDQGLLRGPFLVSCYRHLFTGPRTALKATDGKSPGKMCIADIYDMTEVKPETIAYAATLSRFVLNSKTSWCSQDGNFHSGIFFKNIVNLFNDKDWAKETLEWWNRSVFGDEHNMRDDTTPQDEEDDTVALVAAQRAAAAAQRQLEAAAAQSASDAQQPQAPSAQPA